MTHRIPNRRWLDNPEHKVSKAHLNRVQQAANRNEQPTGSQPRDAVRNSRPGHRIQD